MEKQVKFSFKVDQYPDKLTKDLQTVLERIKSSQREIPKLASDWKRELAFARYEADLLNKKLEQQVRLLEQLKSRQIQQTSASLDREIEKRARIIEQTRRQLDEAHRVQRALETHVKVLESTRNRTLETLTTGFAQGGLFGLVRGLLSTGIGRLGAIGAIGWGLYKTYDWLQEKSQVAREYYLGGLELGRRANLPYDIATMIRMRGYGAGAYFTDKEVLDLAREIAQTTGRALLKTPEILGGVAGFTRREGLTFAEVAGILGGGVKGGFIRGEPDIKAYFDIYSNAMAKGLDLGFSKNERINQLLRLQQMSVLDGRDAKESFKRVVAEMLVLERTGLRAFAGERGIQALELSRAFLTPSARTTPAFATLAMQGVLPRDYLLRARERMIGTGIDRTLLGALLPRDYWAVLQEGTQYESLPVFRDLYQNLSRRYGRLAPTLMMQLYGVSDENRTQFLRLLSQTGKMSDEEFKKALQDLSKTPMEKLNESTLGLKAEMSKYYQGQSELNKSVLALKSIIDIEVSLRKLELSVTGKLTAEKMSKFSPEELKWALEAGIPGAEAEQKRRLGMLTLPELQKYKERGIWGAEEVYKDVIKRYSGYKLGDVSWNKIVDSVIRAESGYNPNAVSPKGAVGLMQLLPSTFEEEAKALGIRNPNIRDPQQNVMVGSAYLRKLIAKYGLVGGIAAYNMGAGRLESLMKKYGEGWLAYAPRETQTYVDRVLRYYSGGSDTSFRTQHSFDVTLKDETTAYDVDRQGLRKLLQEQMPNYVQSRRKTPDPRYRALQ